MKLRLKSLDGLRGIAIIAVILNHIFLDVWYASVPSFLRPVLDIFLVNGKTGVSILFLLTGFLMSWLHSKPNSPVSFWSRRYARLFPPFLTVVASRAIYLYFGNLSILQELAILFGCALVGRFFWEIGIKLGEKAPLGKWLTYFWIFLQAGVAIWYTQYLLHIQPQLFFQTWSPNIRLFITALVNATLTQPFGNYIGMLDGVYWSLITETAFYLLYPVLFVPIFGYINQKKSIKWKFLLFLSVFPFCFGFHLMCQRFYRFGITAPHLIIYFIVGVALGSNLEWFQNKLKKISGVFLKPFMAIPLIVFIFSAVVIYQWVPHFFHPYVQLFLSIPLGLLVVGLTLGPESWGKYLQSKPLVFLGKYSYSLYLVHAICINMAQRIIWPTTVIKGFGVIGLSLLISIIVAWVLFQLVEKPYYTLGKRKLTADKASVLSSKRIVVAFSGIIFFMTYFAFRPPFSLFTYVYTNGRASLISLLQGDKRQVVKTEPFSFNFVGQKSGLGIISTFLTNKNISDKDIAQESPLLNISLKDNKNKIVSQTSYNLSLIINSRFHPFGFPIQQDSKGKNYLIEYQVIPPDSSTQAEIITTEEKFFTIYFVDKKSLFKNPKEFIIWAFAKLKESLTSSMFWFCFLNMAPAVILLCCNKKLEIR